MKAWVILHVHVFVLYKFVTVVTNQEFQLWGVPVQGIIDHDADITIMGAELALWQQSQYYLGVYEQDCLGGLALLIDWVCSFFAVAEDGRT